MNHPPRRLLAELGRTLSQVDPEAALHVEYCPACGVRFAAVLSLLSDAAKRPGGRPPLAARRAHRRASPPSSATCPIHPAEGALVAFARTLAGINEKVFEHARFCTPCLWQVVQAIPVPVNRQPAPLRAVGLVGGAWAEIAEAQRREEDLVGAEQTLDSAASYDLGAEASGERWFLLADLRRDQGRSAEALALYERARACFESCRAVERQAIAAMRTAILCFAEHRPAEAVTHFETACGLVSLGLPAGLALRAVQGKVGVLGNTGRHTQAAGAGKITVLCLADAVRRPPEPARGGWTAAFADEGEPAREQLWPLLAESIANGCPWEAALLGLDFAALPAKDGAPSELARLAAEVRPLAEPGGLPYRGRNLLEPVLSAAERGAATLDQIRHAADAVALCWTEPELALGA